MRSPTLQLDEELRLQNLHFHDILDTPKEKDFDDLVDLAAQICDCSIGLISFVDRDREWIKASKQVIDKEISRLVSFSAQTILKNKVMVVRNAQKDERFANHPHVVGDLKVVFYAGAPIISNTGFALGTISVIDKKVKHVFTPEHKRALKIISGQVSRLMDLRIKNKLIADQGRVPPTTQKKLAGIMISHYEKEKRKIAHELHENFAQSLAGIKLYIEFAAHAKEVNVESLQKTKDNVISLIKQIKVLTKTITPTTLDDDDYVNLTKRLILEFAEENDIKVKLIWDKNLKNIDVNTGVNIYRIIENQLELCRSAAAKHIEVKIAMEAKQKKQERIQIVFTDDGSNYPGTLNPEDPLFNIIIFRTEVLNGRVELKKRKRKNILAIKIPLKSTVG